MGTNRPVEAGTPRKGVMKVLDFCELLTPSTMRGRLKTQMGSHGPLSALRHAAGPRRDSCGELNAGQSQPRCTTPEPSPRRADDTVLLWQASSASKGGRTSMHARVEPLLPATRFLLADLSEVQGRWAMDLHIPASLQNRWPTRVNIYAVRTKAMPVTPEPLRKLAAGQGWRRPRLSPRRLRRGVLAPPACYTVDRVVSSTRMLCY